MLAAVATIPPVDDIDQTSADLAGWPRPGGRLRQAIEKDEFALFCQPILALSGEERYPMAEVLVRMREEEQALLPPGEFLPVFEHYRMMPQLDRWVVRNTVRRLAAGSRIKRFTINLHGQTLEDTEFPRFVAGQLASNRVAAEALLFEIDESDTLARLPAASGFAAAYHAQGGRVLIDGFGRRSVSFVAIKEIRADFVKVDGSIVRKLLASEVARTKLNAILRVGKALGYAVVAEFVEEQDILLRLKALDVPFAQGFGVYQPLVHVPLIIRAPSHPPGRGHVREEPVGRFAVRRHVRLRGGAADGFHGRNDGRDAGRDGGAGAAEAPRDADGQARAAQAGAATCAGQACSFGSRGPGRALGRGREALPSRPPVPARGDRDPRGR